MDQEFAEGTSHKAP